MSVSTQYRFFATFNSVQTEVFPLGFNGCKYAYEKKDGTIFFTRKVAGKLVFSNIPAEGITDYNYFLAIESSVSRCSLIQLEIQKSCDRGVTWATDWSGEFGTADGYWDKDKCRFEITPNDTGKYNCLLSDISLNVLEMPNVVTVFADFSGTVDDRYYTRSRLFNEMLTFLAIETCSDITGVKSEFFQLNPDSFDPINYVTKEFNTYTNMCVSQVSDVKEPIPSNQATRAPLSFKKCMDDLARMMNIFWTIEEVSGLFYVRIEHLSYFTSLPGFDLTTAQYADFMSGTNKYRYVRSDQPKYETWDMPESTMGGRITYDNACGNEKENESEIKYTISEFYTDFTLLRFAPEQKSNLNGLMLFACVPLGGPTYQMYGAGRNEELVLPRLILRFHRHGRPQLNGTFQYFVGSTPYTLFDKSEKEYGDFLIRTTKKTKEQDPIKIPLCCSDVFDEYKYMTTAMGNGDVAKADFDIKTEMLSLTLRYGEPDLAEITAPSEIDGLQAWFKGDAGVTEVATLVSRWADQSGNGNDLVQATGAKQPIYNVGSINLLPAITFDGTNDVMKTAGNISTFPSKRGSCFVVVRPGNNNVSADKQIVGTYDVANPSWDISVDRETLLPTFEFSSNKEGDHWKMSDEIWEPHGYGVTNATESLFMMFFLNRTSDSEYFGWLNGKRHQETGSSNPMSATGQPVAAKLCVGNSDTEGNPFDGDIAEIILFDRSITDIERQQVERYLFKKYAFIKSYMIV